MILFKVVFGKVVEGMDVVRAIGPSYANSPLFFLYIYTIFAENVAKGRNDRPEEDVIIVDCGELEIEYETDENGKQVPIHAEL